MTEEDDLRVLLERVVPQPAASAQRLDRIHERVRRRRRRMAAVTGSVVVAFAASLLAVPGLLRPEGGAAPVAVATSGQAQLPSSPPASARGEEPTTPGSTPGRGYLPPGMAGLRLRPPPGWKVLADQDTDTVFLSSQKLVLPQGGCAHALDGFCTPLARVLAEDGALVMFHLAQSKAPAAKFGGYELPLTDEDPYSSCRAVTGTRQMGRTMVGSAATGAVVWAVACLSHPSAAQLTRVRGLLASADFG
ncbi:hypothetical protein [Actinacidiphila paucisporea]|uniref:Uncharacterized protein n=1 Tax=Actinacidiphila paucisporea TaxID=310782 RepID=A0A1M7BVV4_9ACTN|nr:hypothetical protein [Actinacidiphila paucisporea]SHL59142.1 hypothetical protein SAMN05216499_10565 [Actinacidiphila paucisporea]